MGTVTKEESLKELVVELLLMLAHLSKMSNLEFKEE
ncbi:hypothetical protein LCGC14_1530670 [marine sediment metagenome]|uniref:Uncharacterized protein n=1 Tax=marine sediment metagenome TaxID=412755 RepID=A0A0F9IVX5_9ZZZZ